MIEKTIWLKAPDNTGKTTKELISTLACELKVCEQLLTMGYKYSNHVNLVNRRVHLEDRIASLEHQLRLEQLRGVAPMRVLQVLAGGHRK